MAIGALECAQANAKRTVATRMKDFLMNPSNGRLLEHAFGVRCQLSVISCLGRQLATDNRPPTTGRSALLRPGCNFSSHCADPAPAETLVIRCRCLLHRVRPGRVW